MTKTAFRALVLCAVAGAIAFRTVRLDLRPMHPDEANQAVKFGALLESGDYRFDPRDHHGPTLYYLTLPAARAAGAKTLAGLDERTLRLVPALFGSALVLAFLLFAGGLSKGATAAAAGLAAVSPALTYYSRAYIQETLLAAFLILLIGAGWRYVRRPNLFWALAAGLAAGLMAATKETCLILFAGLAVAGGVLALAGRVRARRGFVRAGEGWVWRDTKVKRPPVLHLAVFAAAAAAVAVVFYSSFFQNPGGPADAVRAVGAAVTRAGHPGDHAHPWTFYLQLLAWFRAAGGPIWSEAFLLALALAGAVSALFGDAGRDGDPRFPRFVLVFTLVTAAVFSFIPYKTPWNMLAFYAGLVLLAGHGADALLRLARTRAARAAVVVTLAAGFSFQAFQAYRANFRAAADPANPYVYAQTVPDLLRLVAAVEKAAAEAPEKKDMLVAVISPPEETWPLPWYLRSFGRVGYWTDPAAARQVVPSGQAGAVIASAAFAEEVGADLGEAYTQSFYGLRPEVVLSLFLRAPR